MATAALAAEPRNLFAHGTWGHSGADNPIWLASVEMRNGTTQTMVLVREQLKDSATGTTQWTAAAPISGRIIDLTRQSTEAVLLRSRKSPNSWMWLSSRSSYGPSLPDNQEVLAMAGESGIRGRAARLWALGRPAPLTTMAATTAPSARSGSPVLYLLKGEGWVAQNANWPASLDPAPVEAISMAVIDGKPTLAVPFGRNQIELLQLGDNGWLELQRCKTAHPYKYVKLINLDDRPAIWTQSDDGVDRIWTDTREFSLSVPGAAPKPQDVAVTAAGDQIRLFWKRGPKILEQRYDKDGVPQGQQVEVQIARTQESQMQWAIIAVAAIAGILILNVILRRRAMMRNQQDRDDSDDQ